MVFGNENFEVRYVTIFNRRLEVSLPWKSQDDYFSLLLLFFQSDDLIRDKYPMNTARTHSDFCFMLQYLTCEGLCSHLHITDKSTLPAVPLSFSDCTPSNSTHVGSSVLVLAAA
jgi:hypothetical protein